MLQQHCLNKQNYKLLSPSEAYKLYKELSNSLKHVIIRDKYEMSENEYNYFQKNFNLKHCVLQIYGAPKLHKDKKEQPNTIPSRTMKMQKSSRSSLKMDWRTATRYTNQVKIKGHVQTTQKPTNNSTRAQHRL